MTIRLAGKLNPKDCRAERTLAAFGNSFVRQADDDEVGKSGANLRLKVDVGDFQAVKSNGVDTGQHRRSTSGK